MAARALDGIRVVEFGEGISAPYCAKLMADMGAEVIKIEPPGGGDETRRQGPFLNDIPHPEKSGLFLYLNTNKLGITLDPGLPTGKDIFLKLVEAADILVESNPPRRMEELGLSYEHLGEVNPRLIMTSITPYGQTGPYRDYKGYDLNVQALGGVCQGTGDPKREPLPLPFSQGNYQGAEAGAVASLTAIFGREITGRGQHVDVSEAEVLGTIHRGGAAAAHVATGAEIRRTGMVYTTNFWPARIVPCKDGYYYVHSMEDAHWQRFRHEVLGNPEWTQDPRFTSIYEMPPYADEIDPLLMAWFSERTKLEIYEIMLEKGISYIPLLTVKEIMENPHYKAREFFVDVEHPEAGTLRFPGAPYKFSATPWEIRCPAPLLGQHNQEIYCGRLGYSPADLARLRRANVI